MFPEPICKVLVNQKICSDRSARSFLRQGRVCVNGRVVREHDFSVDVEEDCIAVDGQELEKVKHVYAVLNKPCGYVCSAVSDRHPVVFELLKDLEYDDRAGTLHTAGRLDCETSGLIVVTTNGSFSHLLASPDFHVEKTYRAVLGRPVLLEEQKLYQKLFAEGIMMPADRKAPESRALPAEIQFVSQTECLIKVREGQFHQVRRMVQGAGNEVVQLCRVSMDFLTLEGIESGKFRFLTLEELKKFKNQKNVI